MSDAADGQTFCHRCERVHRYCECDEFAHLGTHSMHWGRTEFITKGAAAPDGRVGGQPMTAARDELAELIRARCWPRWRFPETPETIAAAIIAAGWRPPRCTHGHTVGRAPDGGLWCIACGTRLDHLDG